MNPTPENKSGPIGPSDLRCSQCGVVEQIRIDWQRCWMCHIRSETRYARTYPAFCAACCGKLHR